MLKKLNYYKAVQKLLQGGTAFRYYNVGQLLLQSGTGSFITKSDNFITKWDGYYKVGHLLQSGP